MFGDTPITMNNLLHIQNFLLTQENPVDALLDYGIYSKHHPEYPNLIQFSYDQIESAAFKHMPIVQESRGIILDSASSWKVVAYPFKRFFNYGESGADTINWDYAMTKTKLDGSLMIAYHYDNKWHVATKGSPDASGNVGDWDFTFSDLFWKTYNTQYPTIKMIVDTTFIFELTSPYNRIVCNYLEPTLTLIGIRNNMSLLEESVYGLGFKTLTPYKVSSIDEVLDAIKELNPTNEDGEGYVISDYHSGIIKRVKVKSLKYVALHHMKDGFGRRRIIELIKLGETSEVVAYFKEFESLFKELEFEIDHAILKTEDAYDKIKSIPNQKYFALEALRYTFSGAMFSVRKGQHKTIKSAILGYSTQKLEELLNL